MADPVVFNPTMTVGGEAAAIAASNLGLELGLTHVSFGTAFYEPTGLETALQNEVKRVPLAGGGRIRPNQCRMVGVWSDPLESAVIGEVGFWAGDVLFAVWSRSDGVPLGHKTPGVDFVLFKDLAFTQLPANSVTISVDPDANVALAALMAHEVASNAHPQYLLRREFADAHALITAESVTGTGNDIELTLPAETEIDSYRAGHQFVFVAAMPNTGPVTIDVNGLGPVEVTKSGVNPLSQGDIEEGAVYTVFFDGTRFQLSSGVGGGGTLTRYSYVATEGQTTFAAIYVPSGLVVTVNGRVLDQADYTATDGQEVVLDQPATEGDHVVLLSFRAFAIADVYTKAEVDSKLNERLRADQNLADVPDKSAGRANLEVYSRGEVEALFRPQWIGGSQIGDGLEVSAGTLHSKALAALNGTDVAYFAPGTVGLCTYRFDGADWEQVGNSLPFGSGESYSPAVAALSGTDVALVSGSTSQSVLRTYRFDGADWTQVGNALVLGDLGAITIAALNGTDVALFDADSDTLRTYRWDGTDWEQVGNALLVAGLITSSLATLSGTDVALVSGSASQSVLRTYRFDGADWTQVGNALVLGDLGAITIAALNGTDVVVLDNNIGEFRTYRFDGADWGQVGNASALVGAGSSRQALAALNGTDVAFADSKDDGVSTPSVLRTFRFSFSIGRPYCAAGGAW